MTDTVDTATAVMVMAARIQAGIDVEAMTLIMTIDGVALGGGTNLSVGTTGGAIAIQDVVGKTVAEAETVSARKTAAVVETRVARGTKTTNPNTQVFLFRTQKSQLSTICRLITNPVRR